MAQRLILGLLALFVIVWVAAYAGGLSALHEATSAPWPYALGSVNDLAARHRSRGSSPEALRLIDLAREVRVPPVTARAAAEYIGEQVRTKNDAMDPPPADVAAVIAGQHDALAAVAEHLSTSGDRIVWSYLTGWDRPPLTVLRAGGMLGASALDRARNGDRAAWDDAHALWILARSLRGDQTHASHVTAIEIERRVNAIARKLPAPAPPWLSELSEIEPRRELAAGMQEESSIKVQNRLRGRFIVMTLLLKPIRDVYAARYVRESRMIADTLAASKRCRIDVTALDAAMKPGAGDDAGMVYRVARVEAEIEATAKVMALKSARAQTGKWPPKPDEIEVSRCADNRWLYEVKPDGSMSLRMSWEVAAEPEAKRAPALQFAY